MRTEFLLGRLEGRHNLEDLEIGGRIVLKWILNRLDDMDWINLAEDSSEPLGSMECGEFLD
jgi:hypothetical protein